MPETDFYRDVSPISPQEVAHNRQGSGSSSSSTKSQPDEQFTPKSATQVGGVLHVAPGVWKSAYIVSDRGIEFSPAHEFRLLQHFGPQEIKATRPLYEQEMSRKIRDAAMAVGPLYKDGDWVETAHYIGKVGGMDIAVSCNHQILQRQWRIGDAVKIDFGGLFVLDEGPPCSAASAVVIQVEETLDMLVMAITNWSGSCPTPLEPQYFYNLVAEEPVYVIGFNGTPAQENLDEFGKYQLSVFQEAVTKEEARRCLKSGLRMVSPGVAQSVDDLSKMSFKMSASVWYGSSGSPVLAVHGNAVVNIGRVVHGDGANSNVVFKYHQAHKDAIDVAVARVKNWPLLFASSIGTIVPNLC